ncbi:MAG TPA: DNA repair protein RecN [Gemmatimonadales bacterium]|jgi:DNA repair protein RecN (Recombination protein N)|nr:DNA repair protein RecN [Gemmatimonadales bacterium]
MIAELRVRDLATIADVTLQLGSGLNVLTGETGAGKSMLVDALALLLGERAASGSVRPGALKSVVEGAFEGIDPATRGRIEELGLDVEEGRVVIRREVSVEGRSRAWVNGSPTTAAVLAELGALLVDLHGQHETQSLLHAEAQRDILDAFAHAEPDRGAVAEAYAAVSALRAEESSLAARRDEVRRRADYLRHVVDEIDAAKVKLGEEEALQVEARRLSQAGALVEQAQRMIDALEGDAGNALGALGVANRALATLEKGDPATGEWREMLDSAYANLSELTRLATEYAAAVQEDPGRLAEVERRRDLLFRLSGKYGASLEAVLATRDEAAAELDLLDTADTDLRGLAARRSAAEAGLAAAAAALGAKRREAADRLARGVNRLLPRLGLPGGKLSAVLLPLAEPGAHGQESAQLNVQLNQGLEAKPLAKVASGGELSRLMLALKVVLVKHDAIATLVFDEVDQGIGGEVGVQVGSALAEVAERHQVLVITHLPQIAARADSHLVVSKEAKRGIATSDVQVLHGEDRINEIARMLGDSEGDAARRHAQAMLRTAAPVKQR